MGYRWVLVSFADMDKIPKDAVKAGYDTDQSKMYVGRVIHEGNQLAVKVLKNHSGGYLSYRGQEIFVELLEVLCGEGLSWIPFTGTVPVNAVPSGRNSKNRELFIGRATHERSLTIGRLDPSHGCLYIPYNGEEHIYYKNIEILISDKIRD